ncbi:MAG TPA: hypothetical protein PLM07_10420 [Candidatus Rifleibacterium sp.]|nr:hypothetical protein [Candidatus Rifleibacterium sp.]HPT46304.1 hypothetical protein [Candidatus Rifleibacterium sp.]
MREATDLAISAGIRRELSGRRIDLSKLKFPVKAGVVSLQGELCFVGLEKTTDETAVELKFIESSLKKLPGVSAVIFELTNWARNDNGIWESASGGSASGGSASPAFDGEGIVCPDCDYVIRFCPCCGKPLAGAGKSTAARPRKTSLPVRPLIKKKRPASPLLSPVVKPAMPGTPVIQAPDAIKGMPVSGPAVRPAPFPAAKPTEGASPEAGVPVVPTIPQTAPKPVTAVPERPVSPATPGIFGRPTPVPAPTPAARPAAPAAPAMPAVPAAPTIMPARPAAPAVKPLTPVAQPASKPAILAPTPVRPAPMPVKPAPVEELPAEDEIDTPDFSAFSLPTEGDGDSKKDAADIDQLFGSLKADIPENEELPEEPTVATPPPAAPAAPAAPHTAAPAPAPARPFKPAPPAANVPDFNFDSLISDSEDGTLADSGGSTGAPAFDLGSLGDLGAPPAVSEDEDTPLPPMRQATPIRPAAKPPVKPAAPPTPPKPPAPSPFEDDDTPLPPMRPATPPAAKDSKDLFASLFSDSDLNLGLPADNTGQGKNPFGNLDLELDVLEVFPGDEPPAPAAPAGKKPPAPAKPAPADDNPFNLDNVIDLDSPVEEKSPAKKKGSKDPFDDFDISKFKL